MSSVLHEREQDERRSGSGLPWGRIAVAGLVVLSLAVAVAVVVGPVREEIVEFVDQWGKWGPAGFVVAYVVLTLLLVPTSVLTLVAGILFGALLGGVLCVLAGAISATAGFVVSRHLGRERVARLAGERFQRADRWLSQHGLVAIAVARNVPALPYGLVNYAAGVTGIPARRFVAGTVLGIVPGTAVFVTLGGSIDDVWSPRFLLAAAGLVALIAGGAALEHHLNGHD